MRGVINDRILRTRDYAHVSCDGSAKVDCAYLVTAGDSPYLTGQIRRLLRCSERVIVLHTVDRRMVSQADVRGAELVHISSELHGEMLKRPSSSNPTRHWNEKFDVPTKRSFAIDHARANGFGHILLVDDDILFRTSFVPSAIETLRNGADIACAYSLHHADVSTLERVRHELTGEPPEVSISGNAMVLKVGPTLGLFPYIYNEDWLFLWSSIRYGGARVTPIQDVAQRPPRPGRASLVRMEQFGELVIHLLFFHRGGATDLRQLRHEALVAEGLATYRELVHAMLSTSAHDMIIHDALSALDRIHTSDVCEFAARFEHEVEAHYGLETHKH